MSSVSFTIIIPTFGRQTVLWETISYLLPQLHARDEIIIIDQNTPALIPPENFNALPNQIKHFKMLPPSLTKARNYGLSKAKGSHILFLDDDIIPDKQLLNIWRSSIEKNPEDVMAGAVDQKNLPEVDGVGHLDLKTGEIITNYSSKMAMTVDFFAGGHFLLPRSCILPQPCFCPHYRGNAQTEEIEYAMQLKKAGKKIRFMPSARIHHLMLPSGGCRQKDYVDRFYLDYCFNEGLFYGAHGHLTFTRLFLIRMKNFIEFHTRNNKTQGHSILKLFKAFTNLAAGMVTGMFWRVKIPLRNASLHH